LLLVPPVVVVGDIAEPLKLTIRTFIQVVMMPSLLAAAALLSLAGSVGAWGIVGHEVVATIAQIHLYPSVIKRLCDVLPYYASCHLAPIAAWADKVRHFKPWSAHMHYIGDVRDHPSQYCAFGENGWEDEHFNVLAAIRNTTLWLEKQRSGQEEALKFLVHFMGDLHMPLHLTSRERGGNDMKVKFDGRVTNLHSVWDSRLIAKFVRTVPMNYTVPLPSTQIENALRGTIYDPYIREIMWEGIMGIWAEEIEGWLSCPEILPWGLDTSTQIPLVRPRASDSSEELVCPSFWGKPIHKLNCEFVWPPALDEIRHSKNAEERNHPIELDTVEYSGRIKENRLVEKLLAMAGIRLASILNGLYADVDIHGRRLLNKVGV